MATKGDIPPLPNILYYRLYDKANTYKDQCHWFHFLMDNIFDSVSLLSIEWRNIKYIRMQFCLNIMGSGQI
jgi:hypothetical protein